MNAVLEVALGLGFVFLLFSIVASAVVEWFSALWDRRADMLKDSLDSILGPHLASELLAHPVIAGLRPGPTTRRPPNYLPPRAVGLVLADIARQRELPATKEGAAARARLVGLVRALKSELLPGDEQVSTEMDAEVLFRIERWFTEQMDRTTGTYKRWTQVWTMTVAVVLTLGFDLDAGRIAGELYRNAAVRSALAGRATDEIAGKALGDLSVSKLEELPIGWNRTPRDLVHGGAWRAVAAVAGWLISVIALGLGAPFWFDALNRVVNLRQTGPRPTAGMVA